MPRRIRSKTHYASRNYAFDLVCDLQRYIADKYYDENDKMVFEDILLLPFALESVTPQPNSIAHKVLFRLAYEYHYLQLYDDIDWISEIADFVEYATPLFSYMGVNLPKEFFSQDEEQVNQIRRMLEDEFIKGLARISEVSFSIIWPDKELCYGLNLKVSEIVKNLKKQDFPQLEKDGQFPRCYWPSWLNGLLIKRDNGKCQYCGKTVAGATEPEQDYQIDHVIPLACGGTNDVTNLVLSCPDCNQKKNKTIIPLQNIYHWPSIEYPESFWKV